MFDCEGWGFEFAEFYFEEYRNELKDAIEGSVNFDTGWKTYGNGYNGMRVSRSMNRIFLYVYEQTSGGIFFIPDRDDFGLYECFLYNFEYWRLVDEGRIDNVIDTLKNSDWVEKADMCAVLPANTSFDDVMATAKKLRKRCLMKLHTPFGILFKATLEQLYGKGDEMKQIAKEKYKDLPCWLTRSMRGPEFDFCRA